MERIINKLIDDAVANVDTYINSGSTWLIFTDDKRWVIELTKDGTLWYNYNFFNNLFTYTSMDVIENQHYITKWVENNVINKKKPVKNGVKETKENWSESKYQVEETIQNGVKHTEYGYWEDGDSTVEYTIQNGVKETSFVAYGLGTTVEDIIQNGVKHTEKSLQIDGSCVIEDVIKEGVKHTEYGDWEDGDERLDDIIQNGVKEIGHKKTHDESFTNHIIKNGVKQTCAQIPSMDDVVERVVEEGIKETNMEEHHRLREVVQTVKNGVKETCAQIPSIDAVVERVVEEGIKETHDDVYPHTARIEGVIKNGIKEVQPLPAQDGNRDWGLYYNRKEDRTKPFTEYVKDVIENGNKLHDI